MEEDEVDVKSQIIKCPEIEIRITNVLVKALIDTGMRSVGLQKSDLMKIKNS